MNGHHGPFPPQLLYHGLSEEELPQYDEKVDVWSLGVVLFEAMTGQQPFMADSHEAMAQAQVGAFFLWGGE